MIEFEKDIYFWLLWIIPVVAAIVLLGFWWKRRLQVRFADKHLLKMLTPERSKMKFILKLILICLSLFFFIIALVNPLIGSSEETVKRKGVDIVFAMDVSKSMLAEDVTPNRLEKSQRLVSEIVDNLAGDRVGIIAYAGTAFPQLPITTDYGAAKQFLKALNTDMVSSQGTAIDEAIDLSKSYYDDNSQTKRVLFLFSDGENHGGKLDAISEEAAEKGIAIYTIGLGTEKGGPIPIEKNGVLQHYKKDRQGETVITKANRQTLKSIPQSTGGHFIDGNRPTREVVDKVKASLKDMEKTDFESKRLQNYDDQFQWFLGFGIFFMVLEILLLERKTNWVERLNLFKEKTK